MSLTINKYLEEFELLFKQEKKRDDKTILTLSLKMSLNLLTPEQKDLFYKLCYMALDGIYIPTLVNIDDDDQVQRIVLLNALNLITFDSSQLAIASLHRLTQDVGRYIFEQTEEFKENKQAFLKNLQRSLENYVFSVHKELEAHKMRSKILTQQELEERHKILFDLKLSWLALIKNAPRDVLLIDREAFFINTLQNEIADSILTSHPEVIDVLLCRHHDMDESALNYVKEKYTRLFPDELSIMQKRVVLSLLSNIYKIHADLLNRIPENLIDDDQEKLNVLKVFESLKEDRRCDPKDLKCTSFIDLFVSRFFDASLREKAAEFFKKVDKEDQTFEKYTHILKIYQSFSEKQKQFLSTINMYDLQSLEYFKDKFKEKDLERLEVDYDLMKRNIGEFQKGHDFLELMVGSSDEVYRNRTVWFTNSPQAPLHYIPPVTTCVNEPLGSFLSRKTLQSAPPEMRLRDAEIQEKAKEILKNIHDSKNRVYTFFKLLGDIPNKDHFIHKLNTATYKDYFKRINYVFYMSLPAKYREQTEWDDEIINWGKSITGDAFFPLIHEALSKTSRLDLFNFINAQKAGFPLFNLQKIRDWLAPHVGSDQENEQHFRILKSSIATSLPHEKMKSIIYSLFDTYSNEEIIEILSTHVREGINIDQTLKNLKIIEKVPLTPQDKAKLIPSFIGKISPERLNFLVNDHSLFISTLINK
jgi:hypothetical protein